MFERFTDRARRVLVLAQEEARMLNHNFIGTEHLLLGLIAEGDGVGAKALESLGVHLETARALVVVAIGDALGGPATGAPPFTPRSKKVLELSLREALQLGHNYIGTEHLALGLVREGEGIGAHVLAQMGVEGSALRATVIRLLSGRRGEGETVSNNGLNRMHAIAQSLLGPSDRMGTQHYLLALALEGEGVAALALGALGLDAEKIEAAIAEIDVSTTSDAPPPPPARPPASAELNLGDGITVRIDGLGDTDPEAVRRALLERLQNPPPEQAS